MMVVYLNVTDCDIVVYVTGNLQWRSNSEAGSRIAQRARKTNYAFTAHPVRLLFKYFEDNLMNVTGMLP